MKVRIVLTANNDEPADSVSVNLQGMDFNTLSTSIIVATHLLLRRNENRLDADAHLRLLASLHERVDSEPF